MSVPALGFVLLFVENPLKSSEFYQKILGGNPVEESPTFVMFALKNGVMLGLWSKYTAEPRVDAPAGALEICFPSENVDALYEEWEENMLLLLKNPQIWTLGVLFVALDPDGHRIRVYKLHEEK